MSKEITSECSIRIATPEDAEKLLKIYEYYIKETAITFEYEVPTVSEFRSRIEKVLTRFPYLVAERDGEILGYCYASPFHERAAYQWCVETTIYLKHDLHRMGLGRFLYEELEKRLKAQGILNLNACIGYPDKEDERLTFNSVQFHEKMDYSMVGEFHKCGYKFNRWYNMVWMEKMLGEHPDVPEAPKPFNAIHP